MRRLLRGGRRAWLAVTCLALALVFAAPALAKYRGTDVFGNVAPPAQGSTVTTSHPSSYFALDTHVDTGITNPGGYVDLLPHFLASQLWELTRFVVLTTISVFTWAFSLDLLNGSGAGPGALGSVERVIHAVYEHTFGQAWLVVGILLAGCWGIWKGLVERRVAEAAGQLGLSLVFVVLALLLVHSPGATVGRASRWTNELSLAFLGGATEGNLGGGADAKTVVSERLFHSLVYEPWVVLEFGGLRHCVDRGHNPVSPFAAGRQLCIDHVSERSGHGGYAERFLRYAPGSGPRNAEYDALRDGRLPDSSGQLSGIAAGLPPVLDPLARATDATPAPGQFDGYQVSADDRPAVDIQQAGGGFQRLTIAALVFLGDLGAVCLLGSLSLAVVLAQVFALVFLAFAPVALVVGVFPGRGHELFRGWLLRLVGALTRKAVYSLVLAIVISVSGALVAATDSLGWLYAFGLQAAFYWGIFLKRHAIAAWLSGGRADDPRPPLPRSKTVLRKLGHAASPLGRNPRTRAGQPEETAARDGRAGQGEPTTGHSPSQAPSSARPDEERALFPSKPAQADAREPAARLDHADPRSARASAPPPREARDMEQQAEPAPRPRSGPQLPKRPAGGDQEP